MHHRLQGAAFACVALALCAAGTLAQTLFSSEADFLDSVLVPLTLEDFEGFDQGVCLDASFDCTSIDGIALFSENAQFSNYRLIQTADGSAGAASPVNVVTGGDLVALGSGGIGSQAITLDFDTPVTAAGLFLTDLDVGGECSEVLSQLVEIEVAFLDYSTFYERQGDADLQTPAFFGIESDDPIRSVTVRGGAVCDCQGDVCFAAPFGLDDVYFGGTDSDGPPPTCSREFTLGDPTDRLVGSVLAEGNASLESIEIIDADNVVLDDSGFIPGEFSASFTIEQLDTSADGAGVVIVTDAAGATCSLRADFRALPAGPLEDVVICQGDGILFQISNEGSTAAGSSACSSHPYQPGEPGLPPGYMASPDSDPDLCRVLTIDSPIVDETEMVYKKDGPFDPRLRLMFSEYDEDADTFPDFRDITISIDQIVNIIPDPSRLRGKDKWTPVKVTCAILDPDCSDPALDGLDDDGDGVPLCDDGQRVDCEDQNASINASGTEICNGLDDDCDGTVDEGFFTLDDDNFADCFDNCPEVDNDDQADSDGDGVGDACDTDSRTLCATLGDERRRDTDVYVFDGSAGETISVLYERDGDQNEGSIGAIAVLGLFGFPPYYLLDGGALPLTLDGTLPADAYYFVVIPELRRIGDAFSGDYCVTLTSSGDAAASFENFSAPKQRPDDDPGEVKPR